MPKPVIEVYVSHEEREHTDTRWHLFAEYPKYSAAFRALDRAEKQGYKLARIIERETFAL